LKLNLAARAGTKQDETEITAALAGMSVLELAAAALADGALGGFRGDHFW